jgi:hypothetical protein
MWAINLFYDFYVHLSLIFFCYYLFFWSQNLISGLFTIISSAVLICLFFLIGEPFAFILILIIGVIAVVILISYRMRRPTALFSLRPATSVKVPNYQVHVPLPTQPNNATDPKFYQTSPVYSTYRVGTVY